jgi:hypothetical protein
MLTAHLDNVCGNEKDDADGRDESGAATQRSLEALHATRVPAAAAALANRLPSRQLNLRAMAEQTQAGGLK